jgi:ferredoxin/coenzyme F420-reducing hydrogenase delta subunit
MLLALSLWQPALSQGPAELGKVTTEIGLDWFYLAAYPLIDMWSKGGVWALAVLSTIMLALLPWLPPRRTKNIARVDLANCNGCSRCVADCPFSAVDMAPRSDGLKFDLEAVVDPSLCVGCGICAGACPTSTPFRGRAQPTPGIELEGDGIAALRDRLTAATSTLTGDKRLVVFGCEHGCASAITGNTEVAVVMLPCIGALPPSFVDYALSRDLADGVVLAGCRAGDCHNRLGQPWTVERLARTRDPYLSNRVPRALVATCWASPADALKLAETVRDLQNQLAKTPAMVSPVRARRPATPSPRKNEVADHV